MLVVMMVALAFVSLSGLVLRSTLRVTREAQVGQERQTIESRLIEVLRRDTWTAYEMRAGDDQTLLIRMNGERSAVWQVLEGEPDDGGDGKPGDPTRTIRRTAFNGRTKINERTWELRRDALTFTVDGGVLVVRRTDGPLGELYSVRLYSQMAVFAGAASGGER